MSVADLIDKLCQEATPGPWAVEEVIDPYDGEWRWIEPSLTTDPESPALTPANARLIAAASVLLPHMAELVRVLPRARWLASTKAQHSDYAAKLLNDIDAALASIEQAAQQLDTGRDAEGVETGHHDTQ